MKPPTRRRSAPRRYNTPDPLRATTTRLIWTTREKQELLRSLKRQLRERTPKLTVQGRSDQEVSSYFSWLCGRTAREVMQTEYGRLVRRKKIHDTQDPAPIELWTDLASRVCVNTEEAMTAAFSQMLTIAATEPVTLRHSIPCKEPPAISPQMSSPDGKNLHKGSSEEELSSSGEESAASKPDNGWNSLDFENIYKYLSKAVRGEELPNLSDFESAVVLHLLRCVPDEFQHLESPQIGLYLYEIYSFLTTEAEDEDEEAEPPSEGQPPNWRELGFCPLNPFMMPLELLRQKEERESPL
ncbi:snRNA-activating protein complex subunit 2 isoform X2 [Engystomops pustulosus]